MEPDISPFELQDLAKEFAQSAGNILAGYASHARSFINTKSSVVDLVTDADAATENHLVQLIQERRPDDGIIGEEGTNTPSSTALRWVIDPLDGTTNFVYSIPWYSVSIGVTFNNIPIAGAVYNPMLDEMFAAHVGGGATLNNKAIKVNEIESLQTSLVATGFSYSADLRAEHAERIRKLLPSIRDIRRIGSAALDLCSLACGRVDAYFEQSVNTWDIAAGTIIAREAGARVTDIRGNEPENSVIAAPLGIYDKLFDSLNETT